LLLANDGLSKGPFDKSKFEFNCYCVRMVSVAVLSCLAISMHM